VIPFIGIFFIVLISSVLLNSITIFFLNLGDFFWYFFEYYRSSNFYYFILCTFKWFFIRCNIEKIDKDFIYLESY